MGPIRARGEKRVTSTQRSETSSERAAIRAEMLLEVAGLLNSSLARDEVLSTLAQQFLRVVAADWVVVLELAELADEEFTLVACASRDARTLCLPRGTTLPRVREHPLARVLGAGAPFWIQRSGWAEQGSDLISLLGASSVLAVPLIFRDVTLGLLVAGWARQVDSPSLEEMRLIQGLANQAATAMENARLYASVERRAAQVAALFEIGRDISANLGLSEILASIVSKAKELLGSDVSFLALLSPDGQELEVTASVGLHTEEMRKLRLRREQGLAGVVVQKGQPIIVDDYPREVSLKDPPLDAVRKEGLISEIGVPLSTGSDLLGVLYIGNRHPSRFREEDAQLLMAFAKQATIAIQNARLYTEAVAQRERAEADRRRLQVIIDSMPEGVIMAEGAEGRVSLVNEAGKALMGSDRLVGLTLDELPSALRLLTGDGKPYPWDLFPLTRAIKEGEVCLGVEVMLERPDGSRIAVLTNSAPFRDAEGRVSGAVAVFQDISRAKEAEQLKDEFISLVSHELRTPLTSIKGAARTLLRHYGSLDEDTRHELLMDVDEEADRLYRLVENLLDFSRAEAGVLRLATEPVQMGKLSARVVAEVSNHFPRHRFVLSFPPDLPPAEADPLRVEQVLRNLLDNAAKYSPDGAEIQVSGTLSDGCLVVSVRDQGVGIAPEYQQQVFGRFQRGPDASTGRSQGVGLGLAICRRLVEAHGGRIWVESRPGAGSTFHFTLPLVQEEWG